MRSVFVHGFNLLIIINYNSYIYLYYEYVNKIEVFFSVGKGFLFCNIYCSCDMMQLLIIYSKYAHLLSLSYPPKFTILHREHVKDGTNRVIRVNKYRK